MRAMSDSRTGIGARSPAQRHPARRWLLPAFVVGHAVAVVGLVDRSWWIVAAGLVVGQSAAVRFMMIGRDRGDDPVFVDRLPAAERRARSLGPLSSSKTARVRADSWLLMEHLLSAKGGAAPAAVAESDPARYAIVSERSVVPLERFATIAEADVALAGVRRQAPTLGARLLVVDLADGAREPVRRGEGARVGPWPEARGSTEPAPADPAR